MSRDKTSSYKVLCFIPMRNCERTISHTLQNFDPGVTAHINEILVVDNASIDGSVQVAKDCLKNLTGVKKTLLQNSRNYGLGGSHKIAFKYALDNGYDYVLVVHGDNSVDVKEFATWLQQDKFIRFDMILSNRFAATSYRHLYSGVRTFFNRTLSAFASLFLGTRIRDFSTGPMNLYRVQSFLNAYENPIKHYPNDVSFAQYLLCYGIYRKMELRFHPVNLIVRDPKTPNKMATQFAKSLLLVLKCFLIPRRTLKHDVFGTFFGHTYRKVQIHEEAADVVISAAPAEVTPTPVVVEKPAPAAPVMRAIPEAPKKTLKATLVDLRRLPFEDPYVAGFDKIDFTTVESCEVAEDGYLHVKIALDVETVLSKSLKAFFLRLFKVYSPKNIILDLNADRILNSRQCHEFLVFCKDFGLNVHLISNRTVDEAIWETYSKLVSKVTLGYEYGSSKRDEFLNMARLIQKNTRLAVNVISHPQKFYHCLGLMKQLEAVPLESLIFQPYQAKGEFPQDHQSILALQSVPVPKNKKSDEPQREHFIYRPELLSFQEARQMGFNRLIAHDASNSIKTIALDEKGNIYWQSEGRSTPVGSLFEESGRIFERLTETA